MATQTKLLVRVPGDGRLAETKRCPDCRGSGNFCSETKTSYEVDGTLIIVVFPGWTCVDCQRQFTTQKIADRMNIAVDDALIEAGLRPARLEDTE